MRPKNDHELVIANVIDAKLLEDPNSEFELIIVTVAGSLDFALSQSDSHFLVGYAKWRKIYPPKPPATRH